MGKTYVRTEDIGKVLMDYIGTDDFNKAVSCLRSDEASAFMSGIGMAGCLIMAKCQKFYSDQEVVE